MSIFNSIKYDFYEDISLRNRVIHEKSSKLGLLGVISRILKVITFLPIILAFGYILIMQSSIDTIFIFGMLAFLFSGFILTAAIALNKIAHLLATNKIYTNMYGVELHITPQGIEQGNYTAGNSYFHTYFIRYEDIEKIEFDRSNYLIKFYGKYSYTSWDSADRIRKINGPREEYNSNGLMFLTYFDKLDSVVRQIQSVTGVYILSKDLIADINKNN